MDETKSEPPKIKVVDRRKFTADGDPMESAKPSAKAVETAHPAEDPKPETGPSTPEPFPARSSSPVGGAPSKLFLELVTMLAGQAELLLVGAEDLPAQPEQAQRVIDYLGVLEEKTAGNLSNEESKFLSDILYQLRTIFVHRK